MCPGLGGRRKLEGKEARDPRESFLKVPGGHSGLGLVGGKQHPFGGEWLDHSADVGSQAVEGAGGGALSPDCPTPESRYGLQAPRSPL